MTVAVVFVGDIGTRILLDCEQDVSTATVMKIAYTKPDGTGDYWDATLYTDTDWIYYDVAEDDLDVQGKWWFQSYIELPTGWKGHGKKAELQIYAPLNTS